jgi:hypothetical protein
MGTQYTAICRQCGTTFSVSEGGGFRFHLLHCEECGQEKSVDEEEMGSAFATDEAVQDAWIEQHVPPCPCGGRFTMEASPRCPGCRSDDWEVDLKGPGTMYD